MKQFAIIGLGNFGSKVARHLAESDFPVLAIDIDPVAVETIQPFVTQAIQTDATVAGALNNLGFGDVDTALVAFGDDLESSVMVTITLTELEVPNIIVKGSSREQKAILELLGANQVVFPEEDAAMRLARTISDPGILDHFSLVEGYSIVEVLSPEIFDGKTLLDLNLRRTYGVECLAIKQINRDDEESITVIPSADMELSHGDRLILLAPDDSLSKFRKLHGDE